jgi:DNA recombination protein RmuC
MQNVFVVTLAFLFGLFMGGGLAWLGLRSQSMADGRWADRFKALAADTLDQNAESFLRLAESRLKLSEQASSATLDRKAVSIDEMVRPVKESLLKMDAQLQALEVKREGAYRELMESVKLSHETQRQLRGETSQLLQALRTPNTRGRWGEMQLRRILEMTGMSVHAKDFSMQDSLADGKLRPDFIVNLAGERCLIIDSKVPLSSYLDACQSLDDASRTAALKQHARHVREHVRSLSMKAYWDQAEGTPEFVVLFMPGDHFLSAALEYDADLMDYGVAQKVILATPMTLIALLRTVAYGWRQEDISANAQRIGLLGGELYASLLTMTDHITTLGSKLSGSLDSYNKMIGSFERNVLPKARRLRDFGAAKDDKILTEVLEPIDLQTRNLSGNEIPMNEDAA